MKANDAMIERLAELSRLQFGKEEKEMIRKDLEKILSFMEQLNEVDTDHVEPLVYISERTNVFREDEPEEALSREEVLRNAPLRDSDYIKVPKVIQQG